MDARKRPGDNEGEALRRLRQRVAKAIRQEDIATDVWSYFIATEGLDDAENVGGCLNHESEFEELVARVRHFLRVLRKRAEATGLPREADAGGPRAPARRGMESVRSAEVEEHLTPVERALSDALRADVAEQVAVLPEVAEFRRAFLGGGTLSEEQADLFIESPAVRFLSPRQFLEAGVPLVGHEVSGFAWGIDSEEVWFPDLQASKRPPTLIWYAHPNRSDCHYLHRVRVGVQPPGCEIVSEVLLANPGDLDLESAPVDDEHWDRITASLEAGRSFLDSLPKAFPGSVIHELLTLSRWLGEQFWWETEAAARFVLTGASPPYRPVRVKLVSAPSYAGSDSEERIVGEPHGRILIEADAWLSSETVAAIHRAVQRRLMPQGLQHRKSEAVVRFVASHLRGIGLDPYGQGIPWSSMCDLWNERHADLGYTHHSALRRAYLANRDEVNLPGGRISESGSPFPQWRFQPGDSDDLLQSE